MSFSQAVIVPYDEYRNLLAKVKIVPKLSKPGIVQEDTSVRLDDILRYFKIQNRPVAKSLLEFFLQNQDQISWNDAFELRIDGKIIPGSNIVHLLKYILKEAIITSHQDLPLGWNKVIKKMQDMNVPKEWIKVPLKEAGENRQRSWFSL